MRISDFYHILMLIVDSMLLGRFKLGYDVLDVSGVGAKFSGCISDGHFILD